MSETEVELPAEAIEHLNGYFRARLIHITGKRDEPYPTADTETKRDMALITAANTAKVGLREVEIDTPNGKRKISNKESGDLMKYVVETAEERSK